MEDIIYHCYLQWLEHNFYTNCYLQWSEDNFYINCYLQWLEDNFYIHCYLQWLEDSDKENIETETLEDQYKIVKKETNTSMVEIINRNVNQQTKQVDAHKPIVIISI